MSALDNEAGGHRIQRIPPKTERYGRVHTSTVTVAVLNSLNSFVKSRPETDFRIEWFSGTGNGGQNRNKTQVCCRVIHLPTNITQTSQTERSRDSNLNQAMRIINERLDLIENNSQSFKNNDKRKEQIGSGMRGDKRRTYRFQDGTVIDHITGKKARCKDIMRGEFDKLW